MNRRTFLGLVGGAIVAGPSIEWFKANAGHKNVYATAEECTAYFAQRRSVMEIAFIADPDLPPGRTTISRADGAKLLELLLMPGAMYQYMMPFGHEIIILPNEPMLSIEGSGASEWSVTWRDEKNRVYRNTGEGVYKLDA